MNKEAVMKLHVYMPFSEEEITEQQALDRLEEIIYELEEKTGLEIAVNVHERYIQEIYG